MEDEGVAVETRDLGFVRLKDEVGIKVRLLLLALGRNGQHGFDREDIVHEMLHAAVVCGGIGEIGLRVETVRRKDGLAGETDRKRALIHGEAEDGDFLHDADVEGAGHSRIFGRNGGFSLRKCGHNTVFVHYGDIFIGRRPCHFHLSRGKTVQRHGVEIEGDLPYAEGERSLRVGVVREEVRVADDEVVLTAKDEPDFDSAYGYDRTRRTIRKAQDAVRHGAARDRFRPFYARVRERDGG